MRTLAIGDIHGCFTALRALEAAVPIVDDDRVVTLGDYIDRGPDSASVIEWLIDRDRRGGLVAIRGNHEIMIQQAKQSERARGCWLQSGGDATLASYATDGGSGRMEDVPEAHWRFLESTRPWFETETHFFVHANAYYDRPLADQSDLMLYWEKFSEYAPAHESGKIMVCGHTPRRNGRPLSVGHAICIDTWAYRGEWLTCLDVDSGRYWQANHRGETRTGRLA